MTRQEQTDAAIRDWLKDQPEHIPGVRQDAEHGTVMDTAATIAFTEWSIVNGRTGNPKRAKAFLKEFRAKFGGQ